MNEQNYRTILIDDTHYETKYSRKFLKRKPYTAPDLKKVYAVIPGLILTVFVSAGQTLKKGDKLLVLEAMKMQNDLLSPVDGKIKTVFISKGQKVAKNELLIEFE